MSYNDCPMKKVWTATEENELRESYGKMTAEALAIRFGTSKLAIYNKCNRLGLSKEQPNKIHLTREDELWLRINFPHMANEICAMKLGISYRSVIRQARRLGLQKTAQFMKECQAHTSRKARESNIKNGTYPAKGYYSPNLQKGKEYQFKPGHKRIKPPF